MTEILTQQDPTLQAQPSQTEEQPDLLLYEQSVKGFQAQTAEFATQIPEIAENQEAIEQRGAELIDEFGVKPEFFEKPAHSLFFAAIANRYAKLEAKKPGMTIDEYTREKEFIGDATVLLVQDKSTHFDEFKPLIDSDDNEDYDLKDRVYDKYTNVQVTQELKDRINDGLLDEVKKRLGIDESNEDPYELRVLNIALEDSNAAYGMAASMPKELKDRDWKDPEYIAASKEQSENYALYKQYVSGLNANAKAFMQDMGREAAIGPAWVESYNGKSVLCMPLPYAEKIMYTDEKRSEFYTDRDREGDFAFLEHEYTHTQDGLNLDHSIFFGIAFEERRAEFFSQDKHGYQDIKGSLNDLAAITGFRVIDFMEARTKGGSAAELYSALGNQVGLDSMLELAMAVPRNYIAETRPLLTEVTNYLGSLDGVSARLLEKEIAKGNGDAIDARMADWATRVAKSSSPEAVKMYFGMRRTAYQLNVITDLLEKHYENALKQLGDTPQPEQ